MVLPFDSLQFLYVGSADVGRDVEYYTTVLGGKKLWDIRAFGARVAAVRLCKGPVYLLADHRPAPSCLPLFAVKDLKATAKQLRGRGWRPDGRPFEIPPGPCYTFKDPSGNPLGIFVNARPNVMRDEGEAGEA